ncbi:MAG: hypothetical protein QOJ85_4209, partial [Solirubrobacteraceae bacterium]|nr:hypothetical protein [Solirubrobacteraceae bacterium]
MGVIAAATLAAGAPIASAAPPPGPPAWADEFDGTSLDLTRWSHRATGPRNDGVLTPDAVTVTGGALVIKTYTDAGRHFSGMISTLRNGPTGFDQAYGYFEARMKFNSSPGQWSAFWLQSPTIAMPLGDPAAAGVEMDIAEHRARCADALQPICTPANNITNRVQQALIWDGYGPESKAAVRLSDPLTGLANDGWHTWALRWRPTGLTFYYDNAVTWTQTGPISRHSQYIILSSEVGASFAGALPGQGGYGTRDTSTTNMQVDYVRVWTFAPVNTTAPVATGTPAVGQELACSPGSWTGDPTPA